LKHAAACFRSDPESTDQIRRSAVSIPSNIAEGDERGTYKDAERFLYIAKGSLAELQTQLEISQEIGYIDPQILDSLISKCAIIGKMFGRLIQARTP
jgi:four helix bundle protein